MRVMEENWALLNRALGRNEPLPRLRFDLRGRCAGQALLQAWCVRLNQGLLQTHGAAFIEDTLPHELAHLMAYACHGAGIRPHGAEWKRMMALLGRDPKVCHNYAVTPARRIKRHAYRCGCAEHALSSIRHRRVQQGAVYLCRGCGEALRAAGGA